MARFEPRGFKGPGRNSKELDSVTSPPCVKISGFKLKLSAFKVWIQGLASAQAMSLGDGTRKYGCHVRRKGSDKIWPPKFLI